MKTSKKGMELIKKFEGCRLNAYRCAGGALTIGYGHTSGVKAGQVISQAQANAYLVEDLRKFEDKVMKYHSKYAWNQNEFDALVSFAFNIGNIDQLTDNGTRNRNEIAEKIPQYNKAGGRVLNGLVSRRKEERALFLTAMPVQAGTLYKVQCGVFSNRSNAERLKQQLINSGFDAALDCAGGMYKVQAGAFKIKGNAQTLQKSLKSRGFDAIIV